MPTTKPTPVELPDELILAAIDRAERHSRNPNPGTILAHLYDHLDLPRGAWTTRRIRPRIQALHAAGEIQQGRRHGHTVWMLAAKGKKRLARAHKAGTLPPLPEAPQHQRWREAHSAAQQRLDEFRTALRDLLAEADALLADQAASSEAWFELSDRLRHAAWRIGSATYCAHEWPEPNDATADIETDLHRGRRRTTEWDQHQ